MLDLVARAVMPHARTVLDVGYGQGKRIFSDEKT